MVEITSVAIAVAISAVISVGLYFYKEKRIEPKRWKKNVKKDILEKQIQAYGELLNFLDSSEARRKAWKREIQQVTDDHTHLFLLPGHEIQFNKIFRENMGYYSSEIIELFTNFVENDTNFDFAEKKWKQEQSSWYHGVNLSDLHNQVRGKFGELRKEYQELTGHSIS